jgi:hypothetical protein
MDTFIGIYEIPYPENSFNPDSRSQMNLLVEKTDRFIRENSGFREEINGLVIEYCCPIGMFTDNYGAPKIKCEVKWGYIPSTYSEN